MKKIPPSVQTRIDANGGNTPPPPLFVSAKSLSVAYLKEFEIRKPSGQSDGCTKNALKEHHILSQLSFCSLICKGSHAEVLGTRFHCSNYLVIFPQSSLSFSRTIHFNEKEDKNY